MQTWVLIFIAVMFFNTVLALTLWWKNRTPLSFAQLLIWGTSTLSMFIQGILLETILHRALAVNAALGVTISIAYLHSLIVPNPFRWRVYVLLLPLGVLLSIVAYATELPDEFVLVPGSVVVAFPALTSSAEMMRNWREITIAKKGLVITSCLFGLHFLDFPYLALRPEFLELGFGIAVFCLFSFGVFIPMVVVENIAEVESRTRTQMSRLISPSVVEQIIRGEIRLEPGGKLNKITMLFSDIRGFTSMSEKLPPDQVVAILNEYFAVMVDVLFKYGGTLDKFVGDEIIGLFGAPLPLEDASFRAVSCGKAMMDSLDEFNKRRREQNLAPLQLGIGINTGHVITGAIGSPRAMQYTAIGDAMNVASRLVDHAAPGEMLISETTFHEVSERVDAEESLITVKGKEQPLKVYRLRSLSNV